MNSTIDTGRQMLLALLRASLHDKNPEITFFQNATEKDWRECYRMAARQGVMAVAWDAIVKLNAEQQPPKKIKLSWATGVAAYEQNYHRYCATISELTEFYADHGIATMILKGVGFSTLYPVPSHREGGDIDIYTYSADRTKMSDAEANSLANRLMQQQGIKVDTSNYKHSHFHYKGIPIENHRFFLDTKDYKIAQQVEDILKRNMAPQPATLSGGQVMIPSPAFNSLFIIFHAAQHYGADLTLHQLCDWAIQIKNFGLNIPEEISDKRFLNGIAAFTHICNRHRGTSVDVKGGEELAEEIMNEILSPKYATDVPVKNKIGILIYKTKRLIHYHKLKKRIFGDPLIKYIYKSIIAHLKNPKIIFQRKRDESA